MAKSKRSFFGHNFGTVFSFEVTRTLKKKSFWLAIIAFPVLIVAIFGVITWSSQQASEAGKDLEDQHFSIGITDHSGVLPEAAVSAVGAKTIATRAEGIDKVKSGTLDAFFYYPGDLAKNAVEVYGQNVGIFENSRYMSVAQVLLEQSAMAQTAPDVAAILQGHVMYSSTTYREGEVYDPMSEMIVPGIFLVLLYVIIAIFGSQMLNATVEEKGKPRNGDNFDDYQVTNIDYWQDFCHVGANFDPGSGDHRSHSDRLSIATESAVSAGY